MGGFEDCIDIVRGREHHAARLRASTSSRRRAHATHPPHGQGGHPGADTCSASRSGASAPGGGIFPGALERIMTGCPARSRAVLFIEDCVRRDGRRDGRSRWLCRWAERPTVIRSRVRLLALGRTAATCGGHPPGVAHPSARACAHPTHYEPDYSLRDYERRAMGERLKG